MNVKKFVDWLLRETTMSGAIGTIQRPLGLVRPKKNQELDDSEDPISGPLGGEPDRWVNFSGIEP